VKFTTWAPAAKRVDLVLAQSERRMPLTRGERGWWSVEAAGGAGTRYRFALDGGDPIPDVRSAYQPEGVFGPSEIVDHRAFAWSDRDWHPARLAGGIIYEIHVGTFTPQGTFDGAIERLDYLVNLGVTHIQLMPLNEFSGVRGWGYDGVFHNAPHHAYGGPDGLKRFVDAAHHHGLAVLVDVVYNHFGPEGNVADLYGPYTTDLYNSPWGRGINLDGPGSDEVRRFFCDNALMWMRDYHCDGLRLDAIHGLRDLTARPFLEQLAEETEALSAHLGRTLVLVPETNLNDPKFVRSRQAHGYGLTAQWNDDFHHAMHVTFAGERDGYYADFAPWVHLARAVREGYVYQGEYSPFLEHAMGRPTAGQFSGHQLVGFLQNHDQIGNHAHGGRLCHRIALPRCKVAAAMLLTAPQIPMLFQGEEWATTATFPYFCDHRDPQLQQAVREGRKREFGRFGGGDEPDPEAPETFAAARIRWEELSDPDRGELLEWYRRLIAIRREHAELTDGRLERCVVRYDQGAKWFSLTRGKVQLCFNLAEQSQQIAIAPGCILAQAGDVAVDGEAVTLGPDAVVIVKAA
jgi:maltooligosyltrehalose trehalohydrolase